MKRWEYKVVKMGASGSFLGWGGGRVDDVAMSAELNGLGAIGWELTAVFDTSQFHGKTSDIVLLFKREIFS
jgi:hypothetical protein